MTKRQERSPANIKTNETKLVGHKRPKPIGQRGRSKRLTEQPKVYNWPKARTRHPRNRVGLLPRACFNSPIAIRRLPVLGVSIIFTSVIYFNSMEPNCPPSPF